MDPSPLTPQATLSADRAFPAIDHFLRQTAHRALSLAIWLLAARIGLAFWSRTIEFTFYILPAAFACLDLALIAAFLSLWIARRSGDGAREPRALALASVALLVPTTIWMFLPRLAMFFEQLLRG